MGRIRRGGYIFEFWIGDHPPRHVHVLKDKRLIARVELDEDLTIMYGQINRRIFEIIKDVDEGRGFEMKHKKFKKVQFDNKKRVFHLEYMSGLKLDCPYFSLKIKGKVIGAGPDAEVGGHSFYFTLENGKTDYVPFDQPLHIAQNPEYMKEQTLFQMTKRLNEFIKQEDISKRELARLLNTSMSQLMRLLDTANYKKELSRLIEIAAILNYEFRWEFKKAA